MQTNRQSLQDAPPWCRQRCHCLRSKYKIWSGLYNSNVIVLHEPLPERTQLHISTDVGQATIVDVVTSNWNNEEHWPDWPWMYMEHSRILSLSELELRRTSSVLGTLKYIDHECIWNFEEFWLPCDCDNEEHRPSSSVMIMLDNNCCAYKCITLMVTLIARCVMSLKDTQNLYCTLQKQWPYFTIYYNHILVTF